MTDESVRVLVSDSSGSTREAGPGKLVDPQCVLVTGSAAAKIQGPSELIILVAGTEGDTRHDADDVRRPSTAPDLVAIHLSRPAEGPLSPWPTEAHGLADGFPQLLDSLGSGRRLTILADGDEEDAGRRKSLPCLLFGGDFCLEPGHDIDPAVLE